MRAAIIWRGAWIGFVTGVVLIAALALGAALGAPFVPFDVFEWMTRELPGTAITTGIDLLVGLITWLGVGPTAVAAKIAEQGIALVAFLAISSLLGAVASSMRSRVRFAGVCAGAAWLGIATATEAGLARTSVNGVLWLIVCLVGWGAVLDWLLGRAPLPTAQAERRRFIGMTLGGATAVSGAFFGLAALLRRRPDSAPAPVGPTGGGFAEAEEALGVRALPVPGTRAEITPNAEFYRIDINLMPPTIEAKTWSLRFDGLVDNPLTLSLEDIRKMPAVTQLITLECISNPVGGDLIGTSRWTGVRLRDVLTLARLKSGAHAIRMEAADGFYESVSLDDANDERTLLVYAMNGVPLPAAHGFPLRIYIPNRHGMKQPKWITRLQATETLAPGFWVDRGWSKDAIPKTTSVIDTVGEDIGGIAYAGARGISKVELQIDDGQWTEARLIAPPLGPLTWVLWRASCPYRSGTHTFRVRAYDGTGALQSSEVRPPHPDGASGIHTRTERVHS